MICYLSLKTYPEGGKRKPWTADFVRQVCQMRTIQILKGYVDPEDHSAALLNIYEQIREEDPLLSGAFEQVVKEDKTTLEAMQKYQSVTSNNPEWEINTSGNVNKPGDAESTAWRTCRARQECMEYEQGSTSSEDNFLRNMEQALKASKSLAIVDRHAGHALAQMTQSPKASHDQEWRKIFSAIKNIARHMSPNYGCDQLEGLVIELVTCNWYNGRPDRKNAYITGTKEDWYGVEDYVTGRLVEESAFGSKDKFRIKLVDDPDSIKDRYIISCRRKSECGDLRQNRCWSLKHNLSSLAKVVGGDSGERVSLTPYYKFDLEVIRTKQNNK